MSAIALRLRQAILLGTMLTIPALTWAQYFGQSKVQYRDFDFHILHTAHFDVYFYPEEAEAAKTAALLAERWYERFSALFGHQLTGKQPLILYAAHPHFQQTNVIRGGIGEGTGGVTESLKRRIVMPLAGPLGETDHVLGHELVHAFQYDVTARTRSAAPAAYRLPLWFMEGMAEYLSRGPVDVLTATWLRQAAIDGQLPSIEDLDDPRFFPYRYGHALWAFLGGRYGDEAVAAALVAAAEGASAIAAIEHIAGQDVKSLSKDWRESILESYRPLLSEPATAEHFGRALVTDDKNGGEVNVAPSLSPQGDRFVFLSERGMFSIDMYLADARTGEVSGEIVETATDPHFDSLQFIQSSGSFDPSGNDFVFGGISKGKAVLSFVAIPSGHITREVDYPEIGEILNPRWSPDGRNVVFSAVVGGFTDLYLFDVQSGNTRRLTDDPFADIQPDWSPDGRIVFVTDRFSSLPSELRFGRYELGILDVGSGEISSLELFASGDHWDPHWSENGLFFLSDRTGRPNIYRWTSSSGVREVTSLSAGVLGITKLSPALTVSAAGDRILFSVREEDENRIYAIDDPQILAGRAIDDSADEELGETRAPAASVLPPLRRTSVVASWLESPSRPPEAPAVSEMPRMEAEVEDYRVDFDLDFVGQPYVVAGSNRFGSFLGGGVSFLWSDMLGDHQIGLQVQTTGDIENVAAIAGYENRASRWYWGGSISHIPFVQGSFQSGISTIDGELVEFEEFLELRQTESRVGGYVAYPFHRAQRIEFSSGFTRYGFSQTAETFAVSLETGRIVIDESIDLPAPDTLYLGDANAALVYDTALLGPTSPLAGTRYRFEAGTSYGSLDFQTALADFRHYAMPFRPFTIAGRILHFGRYGEQSEDPRLSRLFLGYPHLVRGYQPGSFSPEECRADGGCPVYDRLIGSRLLAANLELRFPIEVLFGAEPWSGPFPVELAFFGDAGYAWDQDERPDLFGGSREAVTSAGVAVRFALQRFLVFELDFVRPFERTEKGWLFEFSLQQGF